MNLFKSIIALVLLLSGSAEAEGLTAERILVSQARTSLEDPKAVKAAQLLEGGDFAQAKSILLSMAGSDEALEDLDRLRFLLSLALFRLSEWGTAVAVLDGLEELIPLVADRVYYLRGVALSELGKHGEAVDDLSRVTSDSTEYVSAQLRLGDTLLATGQAADAVDAFRRVMDSGRRDPAVIGRLARSLDDANRRDEAIQLLRDSYFGFAVSGRRSFRKALDDMDVRLEPTDEERLEHARALMKVHMSRKAIEESKPLLASPAKAVRCGALLVTGKSLSKLRRHADALPHFRRAIKECADGADVAYALFNAIRSANRSRQSDEGDRYAAALSTGHPDSTLNDDVSIWRARRALSGGRTAKVESILLTSLKSWPEGDMANESRWLLAWSSVRSRDFGKALARLSEGLQHSASDVDYGSRFAYWLARTKELSGDTGAGGAEEAYLACARAFPMTFYGFLALNRLGGSKSSVMERVLDKVRMPPPVGPYLSVSDKRVLSKGTVGRALWLARVGLNDLAAREIRQLKPATPDESWLAALLLDTGGLFTRSHRAARSAIESHGGFWPDKDTAGYYRLAYPRPYRDIVEAAAKESGVDPLLIWAVMRQESAFVPSIESHANAIGLMQLIMPTAKAMAKRLGLQASTKTLRRPDVNVRLGTLYLSRLLKRFGEPLLAIPGYNAGGGAVGRWLKANRRVPLDFFVENIGARETRNYTRKVFQSYAVYRYLYEEGDKRYVTVRFNAPR